MKNSITWIIFKTKNHLDNIVKQWVFELTEIFTVSALFLQAFRAPELTNGRENNIFTNMNWQFVKYMWAASSEFGTHRLYELQRFRGACTSAQSRQNLRCSLIQALNQEEPSDRKPDPWPLWMAGRAQLKFVMTECLKTQIRLTCTFPGYEEQQSQITIHSV